MRLLTILLLELLVGAILQLNIISSWLDTPLDPRPTIIMSDKEIRYTMRYHGTLGLRIERHKLYIRRDGRWLDITKWRENHGSSAFQDRSERSGRS